MSQEMAETSRSASENCYLSLFLSNSRGRAGTQGTLSHLVELLGDNTFLETFPSPTSESGEVDVQFLLSLVENILDEATAIADGISRNIRTQAVQSKRRILSWPRLDSSVPSTDEIYCKITCNALQTKEAHEIRSSLFNELSLFSWEARAVVTLLSLSVYYAENLHHAQKESSYKLLSLVSQAKRIRLTSMACDPWRAEALKKLNDLIKRTFEITKCMCIIKFQTCRKRIPELLTAINLPDNFYKIIITVLGCSIQFSSMISMNDEIHEQERPFFVEQVNKIFEQMQKNVEQTLYQNLKKLVKECTSLVDFLTRFFCTERMYQCARDGTGKMEELNGKKVLLLISDLNLSNEDLETLTSLYHENYFKNEHEILWIPIVEEQNEEAAKQFRMLRSKMPWWLLTPMAISRETLKVLEEEWYLKQVTTVVLLNAHGKVENKNAMPMIRVWGRQAFPFTESRGYELWTGAGINWFKLLVKNTMLSDVDLDQYINEEKLIFLYGSAEETETERVQEIDRNLEIIRKYCIALDVSTKKEPFRTRVESCISSKMQTNFDVHDSLTQDLLKVSTNYKQRHGFAVLVRGSTVIVNASLTAVVKVLKQKESWGQNITDAGTFEIAFKEYYNKIIVPPARCCHFPIPNMVGNIPEYTTCTVCNRTTKVTLTLNCSHGEH